MVFAKREVCWYGEGKEGREEREGDLGRGGDLSCPAARRLISGWAARIQKRSCSLRNVWTPVRLDISNTLMLLSSELETIKSCTVKSHAV